MAVFVSIADDLSRHFFWDEFLVAVRHLALSLQK